jgi:aspartokinase
MMTSQSSLRTFNCFLIPTTIGPEALRTTQHYLQQRLNEVRLNVVWKVRSASVITVVGTHLDQINTQTTRLLNSLAGIRVLALAEGPSGHNLSLVVDFDDGELALDRIHANIISSD